MAACSDIIMTDGRDLDMRGGLYFDRAGFHRLCGAGFARSRPGLLCALDTIGFRAGNAVVNALDRGWHYGGGRCG